MVRVLMNTVSPDDNNNSTTWRSVCRALPLLLLMGIGAGAVTFGILTRTQAQYTSEAKIQVVDSTTGGTRDAFSDRSHARIERKTINAHVRAIMSAGLAAKVIEQERLADKLKFDGALGFPALVDRIKSIVSISKEEAAHILGAQGQIWTEYMPDERHVEYMAFPRLTALSEVLWTPKDGRNYENFKRRLQTHLSRLKNMGVNFHPGVMADG